MEKINYHKTLSSYFSSQSLFFDGDLQKKPHIRKCVELPIQQTKAGLWDEVTDTLCNLDFIQAKAAAKMTYDLVKDFNDVLEVIPDNAENIRKEKARHAIMEKYTNDLIACAKGEIRIDELSIPESITPWTQAKIDIEIQKQKNNPNRADKLNDYLNFLGVESNNLQKHSADFPKFVIQQAWYFSDDGPVGKAAGHYPPDILKKLLLCTKQARPAWNTLPLVIKTFSGNTSAISITPNGKRALTGSGANSCKVWDLETGRSLKDLNHSGPVKSVCITPDGKFALTGTDNKTCFLWDIESGQILKTLTSHSDTEPVQGFAQRSDLIQAVDILPDAKMALTSSDNTCILWDLESGLMKRRFTGHRLLVTSVKITPDSRYAFSGSWDSTCILWDIEGGCALKTLSGHSKSISSVSISPDARYAVSGSYDKTCKIWDLVNGKELTSFTGHNDLVHSVDITPDGKLAVSGSSDNKCIIWDTKSGQTLKILEWSSADYRNVKVTPDGFRVFSTSELSFILWDPVKGNRVRKNEEMIGSTVCPENITCDNKFAVTPTTGNNCIVWDLNTGKIARILKEHESNVLSVRVVPDSNQAITCSNDQKNILWDINTGALLKTFVSGSNYDINEIVVAPDGNHAFITTQDGWYLWNLKTGNAIKTLSDGNMVNFRLTPDGRNAIYDYKLIDLETGRDLGLDFGNINWPVAISPDGRSIFSGSPEGLCSLVNIGNGDILKTFIGHQKSLNAISFTPDGRFVLSGSYDNTCIMWDLKTGYYIRRLPGFTGYNKNIPVTSDGKKAVLIQGVDGGTENNDLIIWDLESGVIVTRFSGNFSFETSALFSDGVIACQRPDVSKHGGTVILHASSELLCPGPAIVTALIIWDFERHLAVGPSVNCPLCGYRFSPPALVMATIVTITKKAGLKPDQSPCLELPYEAWEDPGLLGNCPKCGAELKFNPFIAGGDY